LVADLTEMALGVLCWDRRQSRERSSIYFAIPVF